LVWDRRRFQSFWSWEYELEAYVPAHKRRMGHYAMPILWGEQILGWANLKVIDGRLRHELGFAGPSPLPRRGRCLQQIPIFIPRWQTASGHTGAECSR
jgi:hypothetical protein